MQVRKIFYLAVVTVFVSPLAMAQGDRKPVKTPAANADTRTIEGLNMKGGDAAMPPFADSIIDVESPVRQALLSKGIALRDISLSLYSQNVLNAPAAADQQVYVGERPFQNGMANPILTWDLRELGLHHAQLNLSGVWNWVSWRPLPARRRSTFGLSTFTRSSSTTKWRSRPATTRTNSNSSACRWAERPTVACRASMRCCLTRLAWPTSR